jgi:hypothetical protein
VELAFLVRRALLSSQLKVLPSPIHCRFRRDEGYNSRFIPLASSTVSFFWEKRQTGARNKNA